MIKIESIFEDINKIQFDYHSGYDGVGDFNDPLWKQSLDIHKRIASCGKDAIPALIKSLKHENPYVVQFALKFLGLHQEEAATEEVIKIMNDFNEVSNHGYLVNCEAVIALGKIGNARAQSALQNLLKKDNVPHDIQSRAKVALQLINQGPLSQGPYLKAFQELESKTFRTAQVGVRAPDFQLIDTQHQAHRLSNYFGQPIVLIWIFAEWCPVCHGEFKELELMQKQYQELGIKVLTVQVADLPRCILMSEMHQPWWPHLSDPSGSVAAQYGADPFQFTVHSEWINRPGTVIIGEDAKIKWSYFGTYFGDRPSIEQTYQMIKEDRFDFIHPERRS